MKRILFISLLFVGMSVNVQSWFASEHNIETLPKWTFEKMSKVVDILKVGKTEEDKGQARVTFSVNSRYNN